MTFYDIYLFEHGYFFIRINIRALPLCVLTFLFLYSLPLQLFITDRKCIKIKEKYIRRVLQLLQVLIVYFTFVKRIVIVLLYIVFVFFVFSSSSFLITFYLVLYNTKEVLRC